MSKSLVTVKVRNGELQKALKIFKKKVEASGHLKELRERRYFEKPTTKRRLIKQKAIRANKLRVTLEKEQNAKFKI
jgi:small subunit ribosomal protein S21